MVFDNVLFVVICSYFTILRSNNTKGGYCNICAIVHLFCVINFLDEHLSDMTENTCVAEVTAQKKLKWGVFPRVILSLYCS